MKDRLRYLSYRLLAAGLAAVLLHVGLLLLLCAAAKDLGGRWWELAVLAAAGLLLLLWWIAVWIIRPFLL